MTIRWTIEEARANGYYRDDKGNWHKAGTSCQSGDTREVPEPQPTVRRGLEEEKDGEGQSEGEYEICVISYRQRRTDPDNLCPKVFIDELVKQEFLPDDSSQFVSRVTKEVIKVDKKSEEKTVIEIWREIDDGMQGL